MSEDINGGHQPSEEKDDEFKPRAEAEIRQSVIDEFELDPEMDEDKIAKLVKKEVDSEAKFSKVLKQKQGYREKFQKEGETKGQYIQRMKDAGLDPETGKPTSKDLSPEELDQKLDAKIEDRLFKKELNSLKFSDTASKEIEDYCKFKKCSLEEALKTPFIQSILSEEEREKMNDRASLGGGRTTMPSSRTSAVKKPNMADFNMKTQEGKDAYLKVNKEYADSLRI